MLDSCRPNASKRCLELHPRSHLRGALIFSQFSLNKSWKRHIQCYSCKMFCSVSTHSISRSHCVRNLFQHRRARYTFLSFWWWNSNLINILTFLIDYWYQMVDFWNDRSLMRPIAWTWCVSRESMRRNACDFGPHLFIMIVGICFPLDCGEMFAQSNVMFIPTYRYHIIPVCGYARGPVSSLVCWRVYPCTPNWCTHQYNAHIYDTNIQQTGWVWNFVLLTVKLTKN